MKIDDRIRSYPGNIWKIRIRDGILAFLLGICYGQIGNILLAELNLFERFGRYEDVRNQMVQNQSFFAMFVWIGIITPIVEEVVFRGLVFRRLKDYMKPGMAVLVSAVLFGLYHGNMVQFVYATFLGIIFALLVERTHSLWGSILAHMGANIWSAVITCFGMNLLSLADGRVFQAMLTVIFTGGILGIFYLKKPKMRHKRNKRV